LPLLISQQIHPRWALARHQFKKAEQMMSHKGRMISQDCARDPHLNALSLEAELLYLLTLPHLDRDGLIDGDPTLLAATVAPRRPELRDQAGSFIAEWLKQNLVIRYAWKDGPILFFKGFRRHNPTLVYDRDPESRFPPPPGFFRGEYGLIPDNPDEAKYLAEAFDARTNYAKELALHAANSPYAEPDELENYPCLRAQVARRHAKAKPGAATHQHPNCTALRGERSAEPSLLQECDIHATDRHVGGFSPGGDPLGAEVAWMQQQCSMDATANDDDDGFIYTSSSSGVAFPSKGGSGGKSVAARWELEADFGVSAQSNASQSVPSQAQKGDESPTNKPTSSHQRTASSQQPPATTTMRQLAKEIAGDLREWTGSARFIDSLDSDQLLALLSWLWLWERLYNQQDIYEQAWARQRYPDNPFERITRSLPGKIITQTRLGNPYPLHPLDSQELQAVLTERRQGKRTRHPPPPRPASAVNPIPEPSQSLLHPEGLRPNVQSTDEGLNTKGRSSEPSALTPEAHDERAAVDAGLRALDARLDVPSEEDVQAQAIWRQVLQELSLTLPSATFHTWVSATWGMAYTGAEFVVGLSNASARDWIVNRLRYQVQRMLASILHQPVTVRFEVVEQPGGGHACSGSTGRLPPPQERPAPPPAAAPARPPAVVWRSA
jgi:hypothetical protein